MKLFSMLIVAVSVFAVSCEKHQFDGPNGTKQLNVEHGDGAEHGDQTGAAEHSEHPEPQAEH